MKSESGESPKLLQAGPESVAIYDFLYVDRARISALYAQLFPQGILTSVKTTAQQSFSDDSNIGTDLKLFKVETRSIEGGTEGIERMFDASWSVPLDVLAELKGRSLVHDSVRGAGLGSIVMANCMLRVIDFKSMNNLWGPALRIAFANGQIPSQPVIPEVVPTLIEALQAVPQAVHAHFITREEYQIGRASCRERV